MAILEVTINNFPVGGSIKVNGNIVPINTPTPIPSGRIIVTPSGSDDRTSIQAALDKTGAIELAGNFIVSGTLTPKSNSTIYINGMIRETKTESDLFNFSNSHDIKITSDGIGEFIGMGKANGTTGWGIRTQGSNKQSYNITFSNLKIHDFRQSGIALNQLSKGGLVENCQCDDNGQNGIGFGDLIGVIARNNRCASNRDCGVQFEDAWDFISMDNICDANGRHNCQVEHGVNGKITGGRYINGVGDGIQIRDRAPPDVGVSENVQVTGACIKNNATNGITLINTIKISATNNTIYKNGTPISVIGGNENITNPNNTTSDC